MYQEMRLLWRLGMLLIALFSFGTTRAMEEVPALYRDIAQTHSIAATDLYAYAVAGTGRVDEYRRIIPWPWTVRVNGHRYQFKTRIDLFNYLLQVRGKPGIAFGFDNRRLHKQTRQVLWDELDASAMLRRTALLLGGKTAAPMPLMLADVPAGTPLDSLINRVAREVGIDPLLLHAVINQESAYRTDARSNKGAMGLMQLMPGTAQGLGLTSTQYYDPYANLWGGATYLKQQLDAFGSLELALAAYNAGPRAVRRHGNKIPPYRETRNYVARISERYAAIRQPSAKTGKKAAAAVKGVAAASKTSTIKAPENAKTGRNSAPVAVARPAAKARTVYVIRPGAPSRPVRAAAEPPVALLNPGKSQRSLR